MAEQLKFDLKCGFEDFTLDIDGDIPLAGITALFGPSGSGKTTLLRALAGLDRGAKGSIAADGMVWLDSQKGIFVEPHQRGAGHVFQDGRLFSHLNVLGNLRYAEKRSRHLAGRITLEEVIEALDLEPLLARRTQHLSGGEQQRVAIGRAVLARPRILLMDEPLSALDLKRKAAVLHYIEKLPERFSIPIIYVTHAVEEVARLASLLIVIDQGRKQAEGPVSEILERLDLPAMTGRFEAGVVLDTVVTGHDPQFLLTHLTCHGQAITMPRADVAVGSNVRLRIRARDVAIARSEPNDISIRNVLKGVITQIAEETDTAFAETVIDIGGAGIRARITRASVAQLGLKKDDHVFVLVKSIAFDRRVV